MANKSLDDLISETIRESLMLLEYRFNPEEAYQVFSSYGIHDAQELSVNDLKKVYRKLSAKYHPDAGGTHEDFLKIHAAYESLVDFVTTQKAEAETIKKRAEEQRKREQASKQERERQEADKKKRQEQRARERAEERARERDRERAEERARKEKEEYFKPGSQAYEKDQQEWFRSQDERRKNDRAEHENWLNRFFRQNKEKRDEIEARIRQR
jgi:DnaJ-class molecular chaperone